ncbi:MAG: SpaA isopeptide-forming pilin-related protein, partial [Oscillospiraceae bacterium]|nr:SpaA isopeptide-forming pilin-related protein [Oscillospiraceae bacterium]
FPLVNNVIIGMPQGNGTGSTEVRVEPRDFLSKTAVYNEKDNTISWEIKVGSNGNTKEALNGQTITDTLGTNMVFPAASVIDIELYRAPSRADGSFQSSDRITRTSPSRSSFKANEFGAAFVITGNTFTFTVPGAGSAVAGGSGTYGEIYRVVITFDTAVKAPSEVAVGDTEIFRNDVTYKHLKTHDEVPINGPKPDNPTTTKTVSGIEWDEDTGKYYVDYSISYYVPAGSYHNLIYFRDILFYGEERYGADPALKMFRIDAAPNKFSNLSVKAYPEPAGTTNDPVFNYVIGYSPTSTSTNKETRLYLFYNRSASGTLLTGPDDRNSSAWPYSDAKTIVLSYRMYLDDFKMMIPSSGATNMDPGMKVRDYLYQEHAAYWNTNFLQYVNETQVAGSEIWLSPAFNYPTMTVKEYLEMVFWDVLDLTLGEYLGGKSLEDMLKSYPTFKLVNWADTRRSSGPLGNVSIAEVAWPIHKSGKATRSDNAVFDYTVHLNYNQLQQLFETGAAAFKDTFDPALEYVPKSFYVVEHRPTTRYYGPYTGTGQIGGANITESAALTALNGSFSVDLTQLAQLSWSTDLASSSLRTGGLETADWYAENFRVEIHYQLRLKDLTKSGTFNNTAEITTKDGATFKSGTKVSYSSNPLDKNMDLEGAGGSNAIDVAIEINPYGRKLVPAGIPQNWFKAIDVMDGELAFYLSTIELETQTKNDGIWDGVWIPQPVSATPGELWSVNVVSSTQVEFILPDETPVRVRYVALITTEPGKTANFANTISVYGQSCVFKNDTYIVTATTGSTKADNKVLYLYKEEDGNPARRLKDAEFELYMAIPSNVDFGSPAPSKMIPIKTGNTGGTDVFMNFYYVQSATTDPDGIAEFTSPWLTPTHKATYLLVEKEAPYGYVLPDAPDNYTFFVLYAQSSTEKSALEGKLRFSIPNAAVPFVADSVHIGNEKFIADTEITVQKEITGDPPAPENTRKFTFGLTRVGANGASLDPPAAPMVESVNGAGTVTFALTGLGADVYYYLLEENDDGADSWTYDPTQYLIKVDVSVVENHIHVDVRYKAKTEGERDDIPEWTEYTEITPVARPCFTNSYHIGAILPFVGGPGVTVFLSAGLIAMTGSIGVLLLYTRYKRRRCLQELG